MKEVLRDALEDNLFGTAANLDGGSGDGSVIRRRLVTAGLRRRSQSPVIVFGGGAPGRRRGHDQNSVVSRSRVCGRRRLLEDETEHSTTLGRLFLLLGHMMLGKGFHGSTSAHAKRRHWLFVLLAQSAYPSTEHAGGGGECCCISIATNYKAAENGDNNDKQLFTGNRRLHSSFGHAKSSTTLS